MTNIARTMKALEGTWRPDVEGWSTVQFTVRAGRSVPIVTAVDTYDGERLRVSRVSWDGRILRFRVRTPSTKWAVDHEWHASSKGMAKVRYTLTETWTKVLESERDSHASQRTNGLRRSARATARR
jgi:hypothetical protein